MTSAAAAADFYHCYWLLTGCWGGQHRGRPGHVRGATWWWCCSVSNYNSHTLFTQKLVQHRPVIKIFALHQVFAVIYFFTCLIFFIANSQLHLNQPTKLPLQSCFKFIYFRDFRSIFNSSRFRSWDSWFKIYLLFFLIFLLSEFVWSTYFLWFAKRPAQIARYHYHHLQCRL